MEIFLDIVKALNTLPWDQMALAYHDMPLYLIAIIEDCFWYRWLEFRDRGELQHRREMSCGVPQRSVLSLLLLIELEQPFAHRIRFP